MLQLARILVGVDFSDDSKKALRYAGRLAQHLGATLDVVHVIDPSIVAAAGDRADDIVPDVHAALASLTAKLQSSLRELRHHVVIGRPGDALMHIAERECADLIVTGSRGMTLAERLTFGSTTERLLRFSTVPVLVVPASAPMTSKRHAIGPIVAGLECTESAASAARAADHLASALGTDLRVVHAVRDIGTTPRLAALASRARHRDADAARQELSVLLEGLSIAPAQLDVRIGEVPQVLAEAVSHEPDAMVVLGRCCGADGHPGGAAIARRVLMRGSVPVLMYVTSESE